MIWQLGHEPWRQQLEVELPQGVSKIAVMVSGGWDSAVLVALLIKLRQLTAQPLHIQPYTVKRGCGSWQKVVGVLAWLRHHYQLTEHELPETLYRGLGGGVHHSLEVYSAEARIRREGCERIYYASQQTPPSDQIQITGLPPQRRRQSVYRDICYPLIKLDKRHTVALGLALGLEPLLAITQSCTQSAVKACGQCFNCQERQWALDSLSIKDPL